jgi:hypothetical protein
MIDGIHVKSIMGKNPNDGKIVCTRGDIIEEYPPNYSTKKAVEAFKKKHNQKSTNKKDKR